MYNVRVLEYPTGYQVKVYDCVMGVDKDERVNPYTGEVIVKKKVTQELEPDVWYPVDMDWDEIWQWFDAEAQFKREESARVSFSRTKKQIYYLCRSNVWDWFVTLTLNPEQVDRYDYEACRKKVRKWLNNIHRNAKDVYYLVVPEQHKDGAWHFHGLFGGCEGLEFVDSGKRDGEDIIYNLGDYKLGFSTATRVKDTSKASSYICKYITKDLCEGTKGRQRYWVSKKCNRCQEYELVVPWTEMERFRAKLYEHTTWKKKACSEFLDVEYFEVDNDWLNDCNMVR